jgi:hypothetical protein
MEMSYKICPTEIVKLNMRITCQFHLFVILQYLILKIILLRCIANNINWRTVVQAGQWVYCMEHCFIEKLTVAYFLKNIPSFGTQNPLPHSHG